MNLTRIADPSELLISVKDARDHCRVTEIGEDYILESYIRAATAYLEAGSGVLGEALVTQTWRLSFDAQPCGSVILPIAPVQSIAIIKYIDLSGIEQTFPSASYRLAGGVVELVDGASWPSTHGREVAFWVDFVAGYGEAHQVPAVILQLAKLIIGDLYNNREGQSDQGVRLSEPFKYMLAASRSDRGLF